MIILDTNIVSELAKPAPDPRVWDWLQDVAPSQLHLSAITVAELRFGVEALPASRRRDALDAAVMRIIEEDFYGRILAFDGEGALAYGTIHARLRREGVVVGQSDMMIAAIALRHGAVVATRNERHFRPCGVRVANPFAL